MPQRTQGPDPYGSFRFRVMWEGRCVAGVSKVSALTRTTQVVTHRAGGDPTASRRAPGQTEYEAITLERGVTHDAAFVTWADKVWDYSHGPADDGAGGDAGAADVSLKDFRKDLVLEVYDEAGEKVMAYNVYRCWPSEFVALPELEGGGVAVAIQSLKLENEGWERDTSVSPPID